MRRRSGNIPDSILFEKGDIVRFKGGDDSMSVASIVPFQGGHGYMLEKWGTTTGPYREDDIELHPNSAKHPWWRNQE